MWPDQEVEQQKGPVSYPHLGLVWVFGLQVCSETFHLSNAGGGSAGGLDLLFYAIEP
jgi:hypothetical protein